MHIREENCVVLLALAPQHFPSLPHARQVLVPGEKHPKNLCCALVSANGMGRAAEHPTQPIMSPVDGMESGIHIPHVTRFYGYPVMLYDAIEPNHHTQAEIAVSDDAVHFRQVRNGVKVLANGRPGEPDAGKICGITRSPSCVFCSYTFLSRRS